MKSDFVSIKLPPPTLPSTKRREKSIFPFWFQIVFTTSIVLFTVLLIHHEIELRRCTGHEDRIAELEARVLELMDSIPLSPGSDRSVRFKRDNTPPIRQQSYFREADFLSRVTLPPIDGYQFHEERYDGGRANDGPITHTRTYHSSSRSNRNMELVQEPTSYEDQDLGGASSHSGGSNGYRSHSTSSSTQRRGYEPEVGESSSVENNNGGGGGIGTLGGGCTTCGGAGGSTGVQTTYTRTSTITHPRVETVHYSRHGGSSSTNLGAHQGYESESGSSELNIGAQSNRQNQNMPALAGILHNPRNVFRTSGIDLGLGKTFTSGMRAAGCGNTTTTTTTRRGSSAGTVAPCLQSYNYTEVREYSIPVSAGDYSGTIRRQGGQVDVVEESGRSSSGSGTITREHHPPMRVIIEGSPTTRQRGQGGHTTSSGQTEYREFHFRGSGNTDYEYTTQREVPTTTTTTTPRTTTTTTHQPYDERMGASATNYRGHTSYRTYESNYDSRAGGNYGGGYSRDVVTTTTTQQPYDERIRYPASNYYPRQEIVVPPPTVTGYKSTCRGPKPLAGHYLAGGTGRLTSADGVFKEWVAADWMTTTSIYTEDYSRSDSFIGVSTVTGAFTVKKAGVYFIYAQISSDDVNGFNVEVNSAPFLKCRTTPALAGPCYVAGLRFLDADDQLVIRAVDIVRVSSFNTDMTYFGIMNVGGVCS